MRFEWWGKIVIWTAAASLGMGATIGAVSEEAAPSHGQAKSSI